MAIALATFLATSSFAATIDLQGVNKGTTNYFGGPLNGWNELEFIPCRVVVNSAGSNQVVVYFNNNANGKPGIQNLFDFTPTANMGMSTPVLTASNNLQDWYYTFSVNVTNPPAYIYYQARMAAGAHLFGGASLHMYNPQLQLAKPVPVPGTPDLVVTKSGPAFAKPGQTLTYSITFSNKLTATSAAVGNEIYDTIPNGTTYANTWSGSTGVQFFQALGNQLWWDLPDLQPGQSGTLTYDLVIATNLANGTILQNNAQLLSTQNDADMTDNSAIVTTKISFNLPPTTVNDAYNVSRNETLTVPAPGVLLNDSDPLGATIQAVLVTNVTSGTLTFNSNGSFTFVPATNFSGTVYFYYVATNASLASTPTKVTINVSQFAPPPDVSLSCVTAVPNAATDLTQFLAQGGIDGGPYCGQPTVVSFIGDSSNGGAGCPASPLVITRTYKLTTGCGDVTNVVQKITVIDSTAPTISSFPADATCFCGSQVPAPNDSLVSATDNCTSGVTINHLADAVVSSNCVNQFTLQRTYVATDSCGNSSSKTQLITVDGTQPPTLTAFPADATYSCAGAVPAVDDSSVTATNACGGSAGVTVSHFSDVITSSNCVNRFILQRTYFVTDACGNATSKTQTITVNGTTPPTITGFPSDATYACAAGVPVADDSLVTATNSCGGNAGVVVSHNADVVTSSNCVNRFTISRTYLVTDACGNSSSKTQTLTVNATNAPAITGFPADATYACASSVPAANDALVTAVDNCAGNSSVGVSHDADVITSSNCVNRFTITRTYHATDLCGNVSTRSQTITVNQTAAPTIVNFPADATFSCASALPVANDSLVTAADGCGANVTITHLADVVASSNCVSRFILNRSYVATDACGNSSSKTQTLTVNNTTVPTITTFPADATYACPSAVPGANDSLVAATDNCGTGTPVVISHDADVITSSNCVGRFTITRTYHATDACGNVATRNQTITVNATTAPTITSVPADATYACAVAVPAADNSAVIAIDGCGVASGLVITHNADVISSSNCVNRFTISRTYVATDACGNSSSKTQTITVNATNAPTITGFPTDATYACAGAVPAADNASVTATDSCAGNSSVTISHDADAIVSSNCVNRFVISRTYHATDSCGNVSTRTQTITVAATTAPVITSFPDDATFSCASAVPAANDSLVTAVDNCSGNSSAVITHNADVVTTGVCANRYTIARTYIATDACGNSSSRTQTITVNNTTPPTITSFPADASYSCASAVPAADNALVSATDGCGAASGVAISHDADQVTSSNCINHFTITRTYRATDACGNVTTRNQTIVVNDNQAPIISCPASVTVSLPSEIPAPDTSLVTASDNCSTPQKSFVSDSYSTNGNVVTITRVYAATDDCGNRSTCAQTIIFNPLLAKPTAMPDVYNLLENQTLNVSAPGLLANDTDPNSLPLQAILVSGPSNGTLNLNSDGSFTYTPNTYYFGPDSFTYKASNTGTPSDPVTVAINVTFVNQQPSFTKGSDVTVLEDSTASTTANWATNIKAGPANESNQSLNFVVTSDNPGLFTVQPAISPTGTLTFMPKPQTVGSANVSVVLKDDGGTANGGIDTSVTQNFVINVLFVNHAPSFTKGPNKVVNNYAGLQSIMNWATDLSPGPANESSQTLNFTVVNDDGALFATQPAVSANGTLTFTPAPNRFGEANVAVTLHDDGGTANGGKDTSDPQSFTLIVNNPPLVEIASPTNGTSFLYPSPVVITVYADDLDGIVTNVALYSGTNFLGNADLNEDDVYTFTWTNAPATNAPFYAVATDNYGATNASQPVTINLGNPVIVVGGPIVFSPSLYAWGQKLTVTNPTVSTVQSITVTFTSVSSGVSIKGVTGTNSLGQPYIIYNSSVPPVSTVSNYATILYTANSLPVVTFTTSASLTPGPTFTVSATSLVTLTRRQFQSDGSFLINFLSTSNKTYYVQYSTDMKTWITSPLALKGNGTQMQWVDFGPGVTQSEPRQTATRFYRVVAP